MINSKWLLIVLYKVSTGILLIGFKEIHLEGKVIKSTEMIKNFDKALNVVTAYTETGIILYQESVITADALHC